MKIIRTLDLFSGMGGIRLAFDNAGFYTVFSSDCEKKCAETFDLNFSNSKLVVSDIQDIRASALPDFDFMLAGFPCQPYSLAGEKGGINDSRGMLFFDILRILKEKRPMGFFLENVKNLIGKNFSETFKMMLSKLKSLGYNVSFKVMNTMEYGNIPQNRERIYIVGFLKETKLINKFIFPEKLKRTKTIKNILEKEVPDSYYYKGKPLFDKLKDYKFKRETVYQWRRIYLRENKNGVCPALTANMGTGGHNVPIIFDGRGVRKLTPRECASFQGFPKSFKLPQISDSHLYKQIGNSVSIPVVKRIAVNIKKAIGCYG